MPRPKTAHPFDSLIERAAEMIAARLGGAMSAPKPRRGRPPGSGAAKAAKTGRRGSSLKGKALDMSCRVEGCTNRSGGPRWGFICEDHRNKMSKKQLEAVKEAWKAKHSA